MSCPTFCLKTADDTEATLSLVNPEGQGNAIPTRSTFDDLDHRYDYSNGDVGKVPVRQQHNLTLSMDEVSKDIRDKLLDWKFKRTAVTLCPPAGSWPETDDTELIITASDRGAGEAFTDDTGRYALEANFSDSKYIWQEEDQTMLGRDFGQLITEKTTHGNGWRFHGNAVNMGSPSSPASATSGYGAGEAGWIFSADPSVAVTRETEFPGTNDGNLSFISSGGGLTSLYILATQLDPTIDDAGYFHFDVWLIGTMGQKANIECYVESVLDNTLDLSGKVFKNWTKVTLQAYRSDWTNLEPQIKFNFNEATEDAVDFKVGPHFAGFLQTYPAGIYPHWCFDDTAISPSLGNVASVDNAPASTEGTMTVDFVIPEEADLENRDNFSLGLADFGGGGGSGRFYLLKSSGGAVALSIVNSPSSQNFTLPAWAYAAGRHIYTVTHDSVNDRMALVIDGKLIEDRPATVDAYAGGTQFFFGSAYTLSNPSFYFLAMRLDRVAMTTAEVVSNQLTAINDVLLGTIELAQGRYYEIVSVPQTPLIQDGNAIWLGNLVLRQISYTPGDAVWYASEGVVV